MHAYDIMWPLVYTDSCNAAGRVIGSTSKQWLKPEVYPIHVCIATGQLLLKPAAHFICDSCQAESWHLVSWAIVQLSTRFSSLTSISATSHLLLCKRSLTLKSGTSVVLGMQVARDSVRINMSKSLTIMLVYTNYAMPDMPKKITNSAGHGQHH